MDRERIRNQQDEILKKINKQDEAEKPLEENFLKINRDELSSVDLEDTFGLFGKRLSQFIEEVDLDHPEICNIFDCAFENNSDFGAAILDIMRLKKDPNMSVWIRGNAGHILKKHDLYRKLYRSIDTPSKNCFNIRLLKKDKLNLARSQKNTKNVNPRQLMDRSEYWEEIDDDFSNYSRFHNRLLLLIEEGTRQHERFAEFGMTSLAREVQLELDEIIHDSKHKDHLGFNQISFIEAAIILGKILDVKFKNMSQYDPSGGFGGFGTLPCDQFKGVDSFDWAFCDREHLINYNPIIIPTCKCPNKPPEIEELIKKLDNWPDMNYKPIFDNLWLMVPEISCGDRGSLFDQGIVDDLIESKKVVGALLGEVDGIVYFISHWM